MYGQSPPVQKRHVSGTVYVMGFALQHCIIIIININVFVDHKMQHLYIIALIKLPFAFNVFLPVAFHRAKFGRFME